MKKFKFTGILGVILLLLIAYVYVVEMKGAKKKKEVEELKEKIFVFDKSKVESVTLNNKNGIFKAKRMGEEKWVLEKPLSVSADKISWNAMIDALFELKASRIISDNTTDVTPYGLGTPEIQVELMLAGKKESLILKVGDENPVGDSLFVTDQGSKRVVLVPQSVRYAFNKDLKQLREKRLFSFNKDETREIEVKRKNERLALKKDGSTWFVTSLKEKKEAEASKVLEVLNLFDTLEVEDFRDEAPSDLGKYGLLNPEMTVIVRNDKTTQIELLFGKKEKERVYVAKKAHKPVYEINISFMNRIPYEASKVLKKEEKKEEKKPSPSS